jgi:hypothetical protein
MEIFLRAVYCQRALASELLAQEMSYRISPSRKVLYIEGGMVEVHFVVIRDEIDLATWDDAYIIPEVWQ